MLQQVVSKGFSVEIFIASWLQLPFTYTGSTTSPWMVNFKFSFSVILQENQQWIHKKINYYFESNTQFRNESEN